MPDSEIQQHDGVQLMKIPFSSVEAPNEGARTRGRGERRSRERAELQLVVLSFFLEVDYVSSLPWGGSLYIGGQGPRFSPPPR